MKFEFNKENDECNFHKKFSEINYYDINNIPLSKEVGKKIEEIWENRKRRKSLNNKIKEHKGFEKENNEEIEDKKKRKKSL